MSHLQGHSGSQTQTYAGGNTAAQTYAPTYGQPATEAHGRHTHPLYVLDDRDILTDLLLCAKQLLSAYGTAAIESTNPQLRQTLKQIAKTESEFHTKAFDMMQQRGWYETPRSDANLARQVASLWTQKIQQHEHPQSGHNEQYQQQWQQPSDGSQWNYQSNSQPPAAQWGQPQQHVASRSWDAQQSYAQQQPQQTYGQSVFGTPPATGSYTGAPTTAHETSPGR